MMEIEKTVNILKCLNASQAKMFGINYNTIKRLKLGKPVRKSFLEKWSKILYDKKTF